MKLPLCVKSSIQQTPAEARRQRNTHGIMTCVAFGYNGYTLIAEKRDRSNPFVSCFHSHPAYPASAMEPKLKCARTDTTPSSADTLSFVSDICGTLKKLKRT